LKLNVDRAPTVDELRAALVNRKVLRLSLLTPNLQPDRPRHA
jgi:hypothetical protein